MMRRCLICLALFFSVVCGVFAGNCPFATPASNSGFCNSFHVAAECRCTASGLPRGMCANMTLLYNRMLSMFGSVERACQFQHDTSFDVCIEDWKCYRQGGVDSHGELCNSTGLVCE